MKILDYLDKLVGFVNEFIAAFGIIGGVMLAFINVVARYVFHIGIDWAFDLTNYLFIWSAFFGAAYCFRQECHIRVTLLLDVVNAKSAKFLSLVATIITFLYLLAVAYYGYLFIFDPDIGVKASGEMGVNLNIPVWIPYVVLPVAFVGASFRVFQKFMQTLKTPADEIVTKTESDMIIAETQENLGEVKK